MKWMDLSPEPGIEAAIAHADSKVAISDKSNQNDKRHWSESFANGCAVALARELRGSIELKGKRIRPEGLESGTEPLTPLGSATSKRIDVTVTDPILGLEVGFSLKGLNFMDRANGNYDKNLTGRLYEMADEVRLVHEHLPHAFMVGIFFLPLGSASDKTTGNSSFANTVLKLRSRTGRLDPALSAHASKCDAGFVGLYTNGSEVGGYKRGLARFLNVERAPPRRGRPPIASTLSLADMVELIVQKATLSDTVLWDEPEPDAN